jgi:IclR family pca regulon transcriptional regulator
MTQPLKAGVPIVRALDRGLALLAAFSPENPRQGLTELAQAAQLDKGTARRLLQTLGLAGMVRQDATTGQYALTPRILSLAAAVETGGSLRAAAAGLLRDLARQTGTTSFLWISDDGTALCLDRAVAPLPEVDAAWFAVGARAPLNSGAGPRVLLAHLPPADRARALALPLAVRTLAAETNPDRLERAAKAIRTRGWELARDDFVIGLAGLGVPILSPGGALLGALSLSGLTTAFGDPAKPHHLALLREAATSLGR